MNPQWNEKFSEMGVKEKDLKNSGLEIEVYDYSMLKKDTLIGKVMIGGEELVKCKQRKEMELSLPLDSKITIKNCQPVLKISVFYENFNCISESLYNELLVSSRFEKPTFNKICDAFMVKLILFLILFYYFIYFNFIILFIFI